MAAFDRIAHMLATLNALTTSDLDRITELRVTEGDHFDEMLDEVRDAMRVALDENPDTELTGADVMADANIVGTYDDDLLTQLVRVQAAQGHDLPEGSEVSGRLMDVIAGVLDEVYTTGMDLLLNHLSEEADTAAAAHDDADGDDSRE